VAGSFELFQPSCDLIRTKLLEKAGYLQADEFPIKVQDRDKKEICLEDLFGFTEI
jgi:hypothetical protein